MAGAAFDMVAELGLLEAGVALQRELDRLTGDAQFERAAAVGFAPQRLRDDAGEVDESLRDCTSVPAEAWRLGAARGAQGRGEEQWAQLRCACSRPLRS
jgi:hypothetical protein